MCVFIAVATDQSPGPDNVNADISHYENNVSLPPIGLMLDLLTC